MTRISLNQTESEKRLHRILYFVKVLRATFLFCVLFILAIAFYMAFGITGLYPGAEDIINYLRPHMDHPDRYGYLLTTFIALLLMIALLVWSYISITRVWRKSLKTVSIFGVILILMYPFAAVLQFLFSYNHLHLLFTILFGLSAAFTLWWLADVSIGIWKVSTSPEVYSFVATLDPCAWGILLHSGEYLVNSVSSSLSVIWRICRSERRSLQLGQSRLGCG